MNFNDIPRLPRLSKSFQLDWVELESFLSPTGNGYGQRYRIQLNPDYQRGHAWEEQNQIEYIEFILRGGKSGKNVYFNINDSTVEMTCIDGLQRLTAILNFIQNKIRAFGLYKDEFEGYLPIWCDITVNIARLDSRLEILKWYRDLNKSVPHTEEELLRIDKMIEDEYINGS